MASRSWLLSWSPASAWRNGRRDSLRSCWGNPWRFDSSRRHQTGLRRFGLLVTLDHEEAVVAGRAGVDALHVVADLQRVQVVAAGVGDGVVDLLLDVDAV